MKPKPTTKHKPLTLRRVKSVIDRRFGGVLKSGKHDENGECCVLELASVLRGIDWTDDPAVVRSFDLRPINDIGVPNDVRAEWMSRLLVAYDGSLDWPQARQKKVIERIVILTATLSPEAAMEVRRGFDSQCREAMTLSDARAAAHAAHAAYAAAHAAARAAASEKVFITVCQLWLEAAKENP